jgi:hypothetical protein
MSNDSLIVDGTSREDFEKALDHILSPYGNHELFDRAADGEYVQGSTQYFYDLWQAAQSRHAAEREALVLDKKRLDLVANEYLTIESFSMPTPGGDDADVGWRALQHYEREPKPRIIAEVFKDDPRAAIDAAILALLDSGSQG